MGYSHLRVYHGPEDHDSVTTGSPAAAAKPCVSLPAAEVLPLLADAVASQRAWLDDFADDEMTISADLYEVLMAYRHFRRPVA